MAINHRLVHLDLKGAPPKLAFYEKLIPSLKLWGATGLLVEYEDTFPYAGNLSDLVHPDAYSMEDIGRLQHLASSSEQIIVPLVQTFGHMEFVLKHEKFCSLREVQNYPNSICPSLAESTHLVREMLNQILDSHQNIQWIHIGGDEVWQLGQCKLCIRRMEVNGWTAEDLYWQHVSDVARYIKMKRPGLGVIVWDDIFRRTDIQIIFDNGAQKLVELMMWNYNAQDISLPENICLRLSMAFDYVWIASAFKGATGVCQVLPEVAHHICNHQTWLRALQSVPNVLTITFRGWTLTGWQRYDHYSVLCELLPAAIPSLVLCLQTIQRGTFDEITLAASSKHLGSSKPLDINALSRPTTMTELDFPGREIFHKMQTFVNVNTGYEALLKSDGFCGWFSEFHSRYKFGNPLHVQPLLISMTSLRDSFEALRHDLEISLNEIFPAKTAEEWFLQNIDPKMAQLGSVIGKLTEVLEAQAKN